MKVNKKHLWTLMTATTLLLVLTGLSIAATYQYTKHKLLFNVATINELTVSVFQGGTTWGTNITSNATGAPQWGNVTANYATGDIEFNATSATHGGVDAHAVGGSAAQDATYGILLYCNQGNTVISGLELNLSALPTCTGGSVVVWVGNSTSENSPLTNTTGVNITSLNAGACQNVWMNASFDSCGGGTNSLSLISKAQWD